MAMEMVHDGISGSGLAAIRFINLIFYLYILLQPSGNNVQAVYLRGSKILDFVVWGCAPRVTNSNDVFMRPWVLSSSRADAKAEEQAGLYASME